MSKGGSAPAAPDPRVVASAEGGQNKETAAYQTQLNRPNQYTPFGSLTWTNSGNVDNPQWASHTTLTPEVQAPIESQLSTAGMLGNVDQGLAHQVQGNLSHPLDVQGREPAPS